MRRLSIGVALFAIVVIGLAGAAAPAAAQPHFTPLIEFWNGSSWTQQAVPTPDGTGQLTAVVALSATDAWAVGMYPPEGLSYPPNAPSGGHGALAEHWDGSAWTQVPMPTPGGATQVDVNAVAATGHADVWAVGNWWGANGAPALLVEHWDGNAWTIDHVPFPCSTGQLMGVAGLSASDVWAVGTCSNSTLVLHWDGSKWRRISSPHPGWHSFSQLAAVAAISPTSVWAFGNYASAQKKGHLPTGYAGARRTLALHWNGAKWKRIVSPNVTSGSNRLYAAAAAGRGDLWAAGGYGNGGSGRLLAEHWNGRAWHVPSVNTAFPIAKSQGLTSLAAAASDDVWAAGFHQDAQDLCYSGLVAHWNGKAWSAVPTLNPRTDQLAGIAAASPTAVWVVGTSIEAC